VSTTTTNRAARRRFTADPGRAQGTADNLCPFVHLAVPKAANRTRGHPDAVNARIRSRQRQLQLYGITVARQVVVSEDEHSIGGWLPPPPPLGRQILQYFDGQNRRTAYISRLRPFVERPAGGSGVHELLVCSARLCTTNDPGEAPHNSLVRL